ncbi:MAG: hypothetical protein SGJ20_00480 [Planctomycetota bacterium]|nr:hypothetical protein [Planctomycetota bacterium]
MRAYEGPTGRAAKKGSAKRINPVEIEDLFILRTCDDLAYEAGFAYPGEHYYRPQLIECDSGYISVASDEEEGKLLQSEFNNHFNQNEVKISQRCLADLRYFDVATCKRSPSGSFEIVEVTKEAKATGVWLRPFRQRGSAVADIDNSERRLTRRLALDDRGRLYVRAEDFEDTCRFLNLIQDGSILPRGDLPASPGRETLTLGLKISLPSVGRCVLKTGLNLLAYCRPGLAFNSAFDVVRTLVLDQGANSRILKRYSFSDNNRSKVFPIEKTPGQHLLQLDVHKSKVRFSIRLFGHMEYEGYLGTADDNLRNEIGAIRVVVDFTSAGIREVKDWRA